MGKSFRNEITPGNFTFRTREFEQMELEFFCEPDTDLEWFAYWKEYCINWLKALGIKEDEMRARDHEQEELSFTARPQRISSSSSHSAGANSGVYRRQDRLRFDPAPEHIGTGYDLLR